ncbi:hypothetical protein LSAT2_006925 [Lamellibrachia satsuma]|nr:hypothetical protein LSAT2_006925 [Lamellibrachia satsuma]
MNALFNGRGESLVGSLGTQPAVEVAICVTFLKIGEIDTLKEQYQADVMVKSTWRDPAFDHMDIKCAYVARHSLFVIPVSSLPPSIRCPSSFIPFAESLTQSLVQSLTQSLVQSLTRSLVQSLTQSLVQSLTQSLVQSLTRSLVQSLTRSLVQSLTQSLTIRKIDWSKRWNPQIIIENTTGELRENAFQMVTFNRANEAYVVEKRRIKGIFLETLELMDFPFDIQDLTVTVTSERPVSEVEFTEDENELHAVSRRSFIDEQEWYLYKFIYTEKKELVNEYSDPVIRRTALCVKCQAARRPAYFFWNIFLITFLICSLSFATFAVDRRLPQNRLQLSFTLVLTSVAFKFVVNQSLPKISYLTYLDKYVLATLIILVLVCAWHGLATKIAPGDLGDILDTSAFCIFIVLYLLFNVIFIMRIAMKPGKKRRIMRKKEKRYMESVKEHVRLSSLAKLRETSVDNVSVTAV